MSFTTEIITDWQRFDTLEPHWNELLAGSRAASVFLTWEWISAWRTLVDEQVEPFVVVIRNEKGELKGIAPFYRSSVSLLGRIRFRALRVMADNDTGSEYSDYILDTEDEAELADVAASALLDASNSWDLLWLRRVAGWTDAYARIGEPALRAGLRMRHREHKFSYIPLPNDFEEYERSLSANRRQQLRRKTRSILGREECRVERCAETSQVSSFLELLFTLHQRRWKSVGLEGSFAKRPRMARFYREFAHRALENGWLAMWALKCGQETKAVQIGYVYRNVYSQLQEGFDPDLPDAGNVLRLRAIEDCIQRGVIEYDFLGGISEHKRRWGAVPRSGYDLLIGAPRLKPGALFLTEIWPTGRFMQEY